MKSLRAKDALSDETLDVLAESRLNEVRTQVESARATHAVVFDEGRFRGVVPFQEVGFSKPDRIFADLIPARPFPAVPEDATIDQLGNYVEAEPSGTVVVNTVDGRYLGIVTRHSLLQALLSQARERSLHEASIAESTFRTLLESAPDAMIIIDDAGTIVHANEHAAKMFEYAPVELIGTSVDRLVPSYSREHHVAHRAAYFSHPKRRPMGQELKLQGLRKGGTEFPVEISINPLSAGECVLAVAAIRDATERIARGAAMQESNRRLQVALDELKQTQQQIIQQERLRALGEMAGGVAHDLNNTLSPVLGYAELLASEPDLPVRLQEYVAVIETCARDATVVVDRLREFCRPGTTTVNAAVNLGRMVRQIPELTRPKWWDDAQRAGRNIEVSVDVQEDVYVAVSSVEFRRVLVNFVFNAVDALPSGGKIVLRVFAAGSEAVIEVSDTGIGMTGEVAARCLEPFFTTKGPEGTGLGLSVCHGIIQHYGGRIEIETGLGAGTTVRVRLPLAARLDEGSASGSATPVLPLGTGRKLSLP